MILSKSQDSTYLAIRQDFMIFSFKSSYKKFVSVLVHHSKHFNGAGKGL